MRPFGALKMGENKGRRAGEEVQKPGIEDVLKTDLGVVYLASRILERPDVADETGTSELKCLVGGHRKRRDWPRFKSKPIANSINTKAIQEYKYTRHITQAQVIYIICVYI